LITGEIIASSEGYKSKATAENGIKSVQTNAPTLGDMTAPEDPTRFEEMYRDDRTTHGLIRPEDISSSNTILSSQIAEARINYGGRGDISAVQKTPVGTALLQRFWPF
jgi:hypothetical protein